MAKLSIKEIREAAVAEVRSRPEGIRHRELVARIAAMSPETPANTILGSVWDLHVRFPSQITKPARGLFKWKTDETPTTEQAEEAGKLKVREEEFYEPFAEFLRNELDECTNAVALGGSVLKSKWGTPDVIGVYKPLARDLLKFYPEIVAAEIKVEPGQPVTAFGQAVAYRLFAAKTYLVEPKSMDPEDLSRVEALCMLFGIGLILLDPDPKRPGFDIRMRAQRFSPDMFYVNQFAERLKDYDASMFDTLFG